jgi:dolichyl-phosphate beta-glucosyltransferase
VSFAGRVHGCLRAIRRTRAGFRPAGGNLVPRVEPEGRASSRPRSKRPAITTSIVVPMYNEAARLDQSLPQLLALATADTEVVFVDDGSTDGTAERLPQDAASRNVRVLRGPRNRGKGAAVRAGVLESQGRAIVFMDADLATDLASLGPLVDALESADVAIGSRAHESAVLKDTTARRTWLGRRFNRLVRSVTNLDFRDTQCGFKAFRAPAAKMLFALSRVNGFAFDVEVLSIAQRQGLTIVEVPVLWTEIDGSKVRPIVDPIKMAFDVARTRVQGTARRHVPGIELRPEPHRIGDTAAVLRTRARPGDLVFRTDNRVFVVLPGTSPEVAAVETERILRFAPDVAATVGLVPLHVIARRGQAEADAHADARRALDLDLLEAL